MNDLLHPLLAFLAGLAIGGAFFGGLWWTVRRGLDSPRPAVWFLGSFILRMLLVGGGLYLVASGGEAIRLIACLLGVVTSKIIVIRITRQRAGSHHAP